MLLNVPHANESMFPRSVAEELHRMRDLSQRAAGGVLPGERVPLVEIASKLRDEHFADELHPNEAGAQVIAEEVFRVLGGVREAEKSG